MFHSTAVVPLKNMAGRGAPWMVMLGVCVLAGCASQRISNALEGYGLPTKVAECMGERLASRLSTDQLQSLGKAARTFNAGDTSGKPLNLSNLLDAAHQIRDPEIPIQIARASIECASLR